mmetsp:Transcript_10573/g.18736  ORF Transcript_10573/g.18736 Transcript_10573/m.18736 type:complete len:446 (-) Transcript_10573:2965-4302(-)
MSFNVDFSSHAPMKAQWTVWTSKWKGTPKTERGASFNDSKYIRELTTTAVTSLANDSYLHIFRDGISPMWEDPCNALGGQFKIIAPTKVASWLLWEALVLTMVHERFPHPIINGASMVVHHSGNNLLKLWISSASRELVAVTQASIERLMNLYPAHFEQQKVTFILHKLVIHGSSQKTPVIEGKAKVQPLDLESNVDPLSLILTASGNKQSTKAEPKAAKTKEYVPNTRSMRRASRRGAKYSQQVSEFAKFSLFSGAAAEAYQMLQPTLTGKASSSQRDSKAPEGTHGAPGVYPAQMYSGAKGTSDPYSGWELSTPSTCSPPSPELQFSPENAVYQAVGSSSSGQHSSSNSSSSVSPLRSARHQRLPSDVTTISDVSGSLSTACSCPACLEEAAPGTIAEAFPGIPHLHTYTHGAMGRPGCPGGVYCCCYYDCRCHMCHVGAWSG